MISGAPTPDVKRLAFATPDVKDGTFVSFWTRERERERERDASSDGLIVAGSSKNGKARLNNSIKLTYAA